MTERLIGLWAHLRTLPVFWLALTLGVFHLASLLARRTHGFPLANPVGLSILILALLLYFTGTPYASYFAGGQWIHFLLTPATVALAVPLYQQKERIRSLLTPLLLTLACGSLLAVVASVGIGWALASRVSDAAVALLIGLLGIGYCLNAWFGRAPPADPRPPSRAKAAPPSG